MSVNECESAPWADIMNEQTKGPGSGEGGSDNWSVFDWDNYDARCIIHCHIMVLYELITFTRVSMGRRGNAALGNAVISSLKDEIDNLSYIRDNQLMERMF